MTQGKHLVVPVSERDHSQGSATAAITLVQYGDYECPYTRQSTTIVRAIQQQLGDTLRFVFRNFPLTEIHPHALHAALAAEAAAAQGKFWQMHDAVECKAPPRSSSMESCIAVPGSTKPCWLHSRQRAEHRKALEVRSQWSRETIKWSNPWSPQASYIKENERRAGQPSPTRHGGTPARPYICGHRSWAKSEWN